MTDHNIAPSFGAQPEPKKPWYKKKLTYIIGVPVILIAVIVNGVVTENRDLARNAERGQSVGKEFTEAPAEPTEEPVVESEPEVAPVEDEPDVEALGLITLRDLYPNFVGVQDQVIIDAAVAACDSFDAGSGFDTYIMIAVESGITAEEAGALAAFGIAAYCPQHSDIADGY